MEINQTPPGRASFWTDQIFFQGSKEEAVAKLIEVIQNPPECGKATINYKTEDSQHLDVIHVQFRRFRRRKPFKEWIRDILRI